MPERYITDTGDPFDACQKQEDLDVVRKNLEDFLNHGDSGDQETQILNNITSTDVRLYIKDLIADGVIDVKHYNYLTIEEEIEKVMLCDYLSTTLTDNYTNGNIQVHFLESEEFGLTVSVIQTGSKGISIRFEPLEESPEFLKKKWVQLINEQRMNTRDKKLTGKEKEKRFSELKNDFGL